MKTRDERYKTVQHSRTETVRQEYKTLPNMVTNKIRAAKEKYYTSAIDTY